MRTWTAKKGEVKRNWWLIDVASAPPLGRLASQVSTLLRGKHKPQFTPHIDTGDFVVMINANRVSLTGDKWESKNYYSHSGHFGSLKTRHIKEQPPQFIIRQAVMGMLAKNKMRKQLMKKLKIFEEGDHTHKVQKPVLFSFKRPSKSSGEKKPLKADSKQMKNPSPPSEKEQG